MRRSIATLALLLAQLFTLHAQWTQTSGPDGGSVPVLLVDGTIVFAGTIEAGIFRSTDGGASWERKSAGFGYQTVVAMAKVGPYLLASGTGGLYRSTDGGESWVLVRDFYDEGGVSSIAAQGTRAIAGTSYGGVFVSSDTGATWTPSNAGLPLADGETSVPTAVAADSSFLIFGQDFSTGGVFRSTDLGASWFAAGAGIPSGDIVTALYHDGSTSYAAGTDVYRSDDLGGSWRSVESGIPSFAAIRSFALHGSKLLAAGMAGIYATTPGDSVWTRVPGRASERGLLSAASTAPAVFVGTDGDGVHRSTDGGTAWQGSNAGLRARNMSGFLVDGATLYGNGHSIFSTTDDGNSWGEIRGTLGDSAIAPRLLYAGGDTLFAIDGSVFYRLVRSTDRGLTWTEVWPDLYNIGTVQGIVRTASGFWTAAVNIYRSTDGGASWNSVDSALTAPDVLFAVERLNGALFAYGQKVFRSTDDGASWVDVTPPVTSQVDAMTAVGATIFAADRFSAGLFRSTNAGDSWTPAAAPATGGGTLDQVYGAGSALLACSDMFGIFRSTNGGTTWTDITPGLPAELSAYRVAAAGGYLFAGLGGNSVWRRPLSDVTAVESGPAGLPSTTALRQNYPNPFNPSTMVAWTVAAAERITVKVYDLLGREAATLFDGVAEPGEHSAVWDASGMPGGVYYVRMTTTVATDVRAMVLAR